MAWYDDVVMPALLGAARRGYGSAMRSALHDAGFDDMPRFGMRMVGGIARNGPAGPDLARQLGGSSERAERLAMVLVDRGYVERVAAPEAGGDQYVLTDRGAQAARVAAAGAANFEEEVRARVGDAAMAQMRATLGAMVALHDEHFTAD
jgi:DNA-binding MarR family transcriptional regulator